MAVKIWLIAVCYILGHLKKKYKTNSIFYCLICLLFLNVIAFAKTKVLHCIYETKKYSNIFTVDTFTVNFAQTLNEFS